MVHSGIYGNERVDELDNMAGAFDAMDQRLPLHSQRQLLNKSGKAGPTTQLIKIGMPLKSVQTPKPP